MPNAWVKPSETVYRSMKLKPLKSRNTVREIVTILALSAIAAFITNSISPAGIPLVGQWDTQRGAISAQTDHLNAHDRLKIDNTEEARQLFAAGRVVFVDARSRLQYDAGHIPGAVSLPVGEFDEMIETILNRYPLDQPMVTYCSGRTCEDSHRLAQFLREFGYLDVRIFIDGFPGWLAAGYAIE